MLIWKECCLKYALIMKQISWIFLQHSNSSASHFQGLQSGKCQISSLQASDRNPQCHVQRPQAYWHTWLCLSPQSSPAACAGARYAVAMPPSHWQSPWFRNNARTDHGISGTVLSLHVPSQYLTSERDCEAIWKDSDLTKPAFYNLVQE